MAIISGYSMEELDILESVAKPTKKAVKNPAPKVAVKTKKAPEPEPESEEEEEPETPKPKKERTPRQIEAFNACLLKKKQKEEERFAMQKKIAEFEKKELEQKVVQKAISLKKKQIKKQAVLDEISDDDTPIEVVKEIVKVKAKPVPEKISFKFV